MIKELPIRTVSEANTREHWARKHKRAKAQRATTRLALGPRRPYPCPIVVTLTRIAPRALDTDNLAGSFKAIRDGVADWLGVDDSPRHEVGWHYRQERGKPKQYAIRICVETVRQASA